MLEQLPRERTTEDPELALALPGVLLDAGDEARAAALFNREPLERVALRRRAQLVIRCGQDRGRCERSTSPANPASR